MAIDNHDEAAPSTDLAAHVANYSGFIRLFKWGAIVTAIVALIVLFIISN